MEFDSRGKIKSGILDREEKKWRQQKRAPTTDHE